jgi:nucleotide-binding universal stress UspA family protein
LYERILVAVDGSPAATKALEEAVKIGKDDQTQLRLLYVMDFRPMLPPGHRSSTTTKSSNLGKGKPIECFAKPRKRSRLPG